ncbi:MAG TPA: VTT domain-containing protein [Blastocatellia bacterium]|nr:VTT domain-containing protein [Blastocatellia bacterium]
MLFHLIIGLAIFWTESVIEFLRELGAAGLFLMGALDNSFFYLPFANEILLLMLMSSSGGSYLWIIYVIIAALGSVAGVLVLDLFARKLSKESLERYVKPQRFRWLKSKLQGHTLWALLLASMMPPAFPFRVFVITASALRSPRGKMLIAVFSGRVIRFGYEALLIMYFGQQFLELMGSQTMQYIVYGLIAVAIVGSIISIYSLVIAR